jgi:hypothetical protein
MLHFFSVCLQTQLDREVWILEVKGWKGKNAGSDRSSRYGNDTYTNVKLRREAAVILDNPELLMMHAQARNDVCHVLFFYSQALGGGLKDASAGGSIGIDIMIRVFPARGITSQSNCVDIRRR